MQMSHTHRLLILCRAIRKLAFRRNLADIHFLRVVNINTIAALYNDTRIMYLSAAMTCLKVSNMTTFPLILLATMSILMPEVRLSLA